MLQPIDKFFYLLKGETVVPCSSEEWAKSENDHEIIALDLVGKIRISTVFLGVDHNFRGVGAPILFETMMFDHGSDNLDFGKFEQARYSTYSEAVEGHQCAVEFARTLRQPSLDA